MTENVPFRDVDIAGGRPGENLSDLEGVHRLSLVIHFGHFFCPHCGDVDPHLHNGILAVVVLYEVAGDGLLL